MFGSQIRDKDGVAATVGFPCHESWANELIHLILFTAGVRGNGCFAATIWTDSARVFGRALQDIRILPGEGHCRDVPS